MKKFICLFVFVFLFSSTCLSQINYVLNPSFEDTVSCPTGMGKINRAVGWDTLLGGGGGNPDLLHSCCTTNCGVPYHHFNTGYQFAKTGKAYVNIDAAKNGGVFREYIQSQLKERLKSGETYCVKFYVNLSNFSKAYLGTLGAYLDDGSVMTYTNFGLAYANAFYQPVIPQVFNTTQVLNDTLNWMKIEGSIVATGTEEYITMGNFFPDSLSQIVYWTTFWFSTFYIDDVSVIPTNLPAYAGNDTLIQPGDSVFIGRQPEIGLDEDCIWFVNGVPIDTVAGLWVQPDSTTTYVLEQTICGNVSWDTVTVSVDIGVGVATFELDKRFKVYPNPATNLLTIESPVTNGQLIISNLLGQEVLRQEVAEKNFSIDVSKLVKGVYFVRMESVQGRIVGRFLKE